MKRAICVTLDKEVIERLDEKAKQIGMKRSTYLNYLLRRTFGMLPGWKY